MDERLRRRAWELSKAVRIRASLSARRSTTALFILGCQRSGTTMLGDTLAKDRRVKAVREFSAVTLPAPGRRPWSISSTSRFGIRMKPLDEVAATIERLRYPLTVLKPLVESQRAPEILGAIDGSVAVWVFRDYRDVARSNVELFTPEVTRVNLEPMIRPEPGNWRSELVPADVRELIARHYSPDMSPFDGGALFWYARNRLFGHLDLAADARVMALRYEDLVAAPERSMRAVYAHAGVPFPGARIVEDIHPRSVGLGRELDLSPEIQEACERVWAELSAAAAGDLESGRQP
jgi:hypothetical protein